MYCLTTIRSITRVRTGVIDIGRKSAGCCGVVSFGIRLIHACFHCTGTVDVRSDKLNSTVTGPQNAAAPSLRNQAGRSSRPVAVDHRPSRIRKTVYSVILSDSSRGTDRFCSGGS